MKFDLLWNQNGFSESTIEEYVFDDFDLMSMFSDLINYNYNFLMPTVLQIPDYNTVLFRQQVMIDFLNDKKNVLESIKDSLDNLILLYKKYIDSKHIFYKTVNFLLFIESYLAFVENTVLLVNDVDFVSSELNRFKKFLNDEANSENLKILKTDFIISFNHFDNMRNFAVYQEAKALRVAHSFGKTKFEDRLLELSKRLNIEVNPYKGGGKKDKLSGHYLEAIIELYQEDYQYLVDFYNKYHDLNFELENLSYDFAYFLFFKTFIEKVASKNIPLSKVNINKKGIITFKELYDITLISKTDYIISNDVLLDKDHHIELITGVNSGGKTSYIRSIGINYILSLLTGHAFCKEANIYPVKYLQTHFPNDENFKIGFGRLNDELSRLEKMSATFSMDSFIILNETFSSTDEMTANKYTLELLDKLNTTHTFCLYVTHQQKLFDCTLPTSVKVLSPTIDINDNNKRLYKLMVVTDKASSYTYDIWPDKRPIK